MFVSLQIYLTDLYQAMRQFAPFCHKANEISFSNVSLTAVGAIRRQMLTFS